LALHVLSSVTHIPFFQAAIGTALFLISLIIIPLLVTFISEFTMWLPTLLGLA
jgi:TRAP-type C4-dicarboxylate transport system permease large subunit